MNFNVNLQGRVKNFQLQSNNAMIPLFESIVNSIQVKSRNLLREMCSGLQCRWMTNILLIMDQ